MSDVSGSGACPPRFMGQRSSREVRRKPRTPLPHGYPVTAGTPTAYIDMAATDPLRRKATTRVFRIGHRSMTALQRWDEPNQDEAFMTAIYTRRDAEPDES